MKKGVFNTVLVCVAFVALVIGLTFNKMVTAPPAQLTHAQLLENGFFLYEVPRQLNDFSLEDHEGSRFTNSELEGKWTLIFFGFTYCPDICPLTMVTLGQFKQLLGDSPYAEDMQVLMVSVDPERDTVEKLAEYVAYFDDEFIGARGPYIDIFNFASQLNVAFTYTPATIGDYLVNHSGEIVLINPNGHFHGFFRSPHDPQRLLDNYTAVRNRW